MLNPPVMAPAPLVQGPMPPAAAEEPAPTGSYEQVTDAPSRTFPNIVVDPAEEKRIVDICVRFKKSAIEAGREKKERLRSCYSYYKQKFTGDGDLLPSIVTEMTDRDVQSNRPRIFLPIIKQIVVLLFSYLKMTLFPDDQDYCRIRGKDTESAQMEAALTEAYNQILRTNRISEKMSPSLLHLCVYGNSISHPTITDEIAFEWVFDRMSGQYRMQENNELPKPDLQIFSPMNFHLDPFCKDKRRAKWVYTDNKKLQEILDSDLYYNKQRAKDVASQTVDRNSQAQGAVTISGITGLQDTFHDTEDNVAYDLYYFTCLKTSPDTEYRNFLVGIVGDQVLVRFHPNLQPRGLNPAVICDWRPDPESPYGDGPAEDIMEIQRLANILENYKLEVMARAGNRYEAKEGTDLTSFFGFAGGVAFSDDGKSVRSVSGDFSEIAAITNEMGILKAEAQITTGANQPFQGAANIDFKKTATEIAAISESAITMMREVVEHVAITGVEQTLELLMYLVADLSDQPVEIRVDDAVTGTRFFNIDLSVLRSGRYYVEMVSQNPSQNKKAQMELLQGFMELVLSSPQLVPFLKNGGYDIFKRMSLLAGIKDFDELINTPAEIAQGFGMPGMMPQPALPPEGPPPDANSPQ